MQQINVIQLGSPTGLYGAERWILALIKHLDPGKVRSIVAAIKDDPELGVPLCREADNLGFQTQVFEASGRFNLAAVRQLRRYILENDIHILHTHFYKTDLIGLLAVRGTSCRIITTPHGWSTRADFKLRCYEQLDRMLFPFMNAVVPLSPELYTSLARSSLHRLIHSLCHGKSTNNAITNNKPTNNPITNNESPNNEPNEPPNPRITSQRITNNESTNNAITNNKSTNLRLIQNGVDISEIESVQSIAPELQPLRMNDDFIFGYIGQVIPRKGLDLMLHALAQLGDEVSWKAVIVGDGEQRQELEEMAERLGVRDRMRFFGFRDNRLEFLRGFDCFVLPSRLEGIPRCLMEAMAADIPVIGSDIPGCTDLIEHGSTGLLFANENTEALAQALRKMTLEPETRAELAASAKELVREHYSADRMAKEYEQLYWAMT